MNAYRLSNSSYDSPPDVFGGAPSGPGARQSRYMLALQINDPSDEYLGSDEYLVKLHDAVENFRSHDFLRHPCTFVDQSPNLSP